jgi:hypothetical protein
MMTYSLRIRSNRKTHYSAFLLRMHDMNLPNRSHTIHMVKGAPRQATSPTGASTSQPLPAMQTGQNPHDPLTLLNGPMGHGVMAGINPFATMGLNPNDPNMVGHLSYSVVSECSAILSRIDARVDGIPGVHAANDGHDV